MKTILLVFFLTIAWTSCLTAQEDSQSLFNGTDFTHWGGTGKTKIAGYHVENGLITSTKKCWNLISEKEYQDYVLDFEFRLTPGANNGLGIHYPGTGDAAYVGIEIQILDDTHPKYKNLKDYQYHGSLYTLVPAKRGHLKPTGEWNHQRVTVDGPHVIVKLNGTVITDANLDQLNLTHPDHKGAKRRSGKICFCGHGDILSLRNIRIAEKQRPVEKSGLRHPTRVQLIQPIRKTSFNDDGDCGEKKMGGNPRKVSGNLVFDAANDGRRQVDPQIAVGKDHVLTATNTGLIIYSKQGQYIKGVSQKCFNGGIDPKLMYDFNNQVYLFNLWNPWDSGKRKPVNISISETGDPMGAWNTYSIPLPHAVDGGGLGISKKWIGYSFPGANEGTVVMSVSDAKLGKPTKAYFFSGSLGHPVNSQDPSDALYFLRLTEKKIQITRITKDGGSDDSAPVAELIAHQAHNWPSFRWPPPSPQRESSQLVASGDRSPKNIVLQSAHLWFSQNIEIDGRSAIRWSQIDLEGNVVHSGTLSDDKNSLIQTSISVNQNLDVMLGFQETGPDMFISPRIAFRRSSDPANEMRTNIDIGTGQAATDGQSWGDYSGSALDGANRTDLWTIQSITDRNGQGDTVVVKLRSDR